MIRFSRAIAPVAMLVHPLPQRIQHRPRRVRSPGRYRARTLVLAETLAACLDDMLRTDLDYGNVRNGGLSFRPVLHEVSTTCLQRPGRLQSWHISE